MLQAAKFQRLYILLHPCLKGGGGYARLEQTRGKYTLTVNAHGFSPSEEGIRVLLAAREDGGGSAVCDLGTLPISAKGQSSLKREISATPGGLPISSYSALCIAKDWPNPKLLLLGAFEENNTLSTYLMGETVCRYLSVPSKTADESTKEQETACATSPSSAVSQVPSYKVPVGGPTASARPDATQTSVQPSISQELPFKTDLLPDNVHLQPVPFPLARASLPPKPPFEPAASQAVPSLPADEPPKGSFDPAVFTSAVERAVFPPEIPAAGPPSGRPHVTALPRLQWPSAVKELENYFFTYPPFAPFDAPGWRFVQVPMAAGSTIPYYAVGMLARDGKVTQVAYAVPGERGGLPPPGFSGYRWQQGRNGQGYWTLWKRA